MTYSYIHENVSTLRRRLNQNQKEFISLYLSDDIGNPMMSLSKFSNFENRGLKDSEEIVGVLADKLAIKKDVFFQTPESFSESLDALLENELSEQIQLNEKAVSEKTDIIKLVEEINAYLVQEILDGRLAPGKKIPSDRVLAEHFLVSRNLIREALKSLHVLGLIDIIPGQGTFIAQDSQRFFIAPLSWSFYMNNQDRTQVLDIRHALEKESARLAAINGDIPTLTHLMQVHNDATIAFENGDTKRFLELDLAFHLAISECSKNQIIHNLLMTIRKLVYQESQAALSNKEQMEAIQKEHTAIYNAILIKDSNAATLAMGQHLERFSTRSKENKGA